MAGWHPFEPEDIGHVVLITKTDRTMVCGRLAAWAFNPGLPGLVYVLEHDEPTSTTVDSLRWVAVYPNPEEAVPNFGGPIIRTNPNPITQDRKHE